MNIAAAIVSEKGEILFPKQMHCWFKDKVSKHVKNFLNLMNSEDDSTTLTYVESKDVRYIYKQTEDLYWILVTRIESDLFADIHIMGKFVETVVECGSIETNSHSISDYQRELFYRHIWHPWDGECQFCGFHLSQRSTESEFWVGKFELRLQFFIEVTNNEVPASDVDYYNILIEEAWVVAAQLDTYGGNDAIKFDDEDFDRISCAESIDEERLIDCCRLKCRLEDIQLEVKRIEDPYLRLFARRDLIQDCTTINLDQTLQIGSAPTFEQVEFAGNGH